MLLPCVSVVDVKPLYICEELFVYKHKSNYNCAGAINFNLGSDIIKDNFDFAYYFNKTDINPTVLNGGYEIVLANWPNDKHIVCNINNNIPIKIPSFPYILVNRRVLCNCGVKVENNFLLESIAVCHGTEAILVMYFTVNTVFVNCFDNLLIL